MARTSRYWIVDLKHGKTYKGGNTKQTARKKSEKVLDELPYRTKVQLFDVKTKKFTRFKRGKIY